MRSLLLTPVLLLAGACVIDTVPLPDQRDPGDTAGEYNGGGGDLDPPAGADGDGVPSGGDPTLDEDLDYATWSDCGGFDVTQPDTAASATCLCDGVNACAAVAGLTWLPQGSERFRVCGTRGDSCLVARFVEVEGGGAGELCVVSRATPSCEEPPLASAALDGECTLLFECNLLLEDCPADPVACP